MKKIYYWDFDSPVGNVKAAQTNSGVCFIGLAHKSNLDFERIVELRFGLRPLKDESAFIGIEKAFQEYFKGTLRRFDLPLDISIGTPFQKRVWTLIKDIPFGQVRSYKWVAGEIDMSEASRAVGNANGKNPIPIILYRATE